MKTMSKFLLIMRGSRLGELFNTKEWHHLNFSTYQFLCHERSQTANLFGQGQKNFVRQQRFCFASNSETKAAREKVNAPFYSTN
jgi:hypothetical protein